MYKSIVVTIGLALVLIAVISAVSMQQKVYAQGSPGVGSVGGSGSGNPGSGGNPVLFPPGFPPLGTNSGGSSSSGAAGGSGAILDEPNLHLFPIGGVGTQGGPGGASVGPGSGSYGCSLLNCGGGGGVLNSGGNSIGKGGAP